MRHLAITLFAILLSLGLPRAEAAPSTIDVTLSATPSAGRSPVFSGRTNLPDETALNIAVETPTGRVLEQQIVSVRSGRFATAPFGPFVPGGYVLHVLSYAAVLQPPTVQAVIGDLGEHLAGRLVAPSQTLPGQGNVVDAHFPITIR